uniref:DUF725 domain-containing protein n=1 Tax=Rhabditophanes sp. KR3021 TaxID=114890 RepID=A0AC35TUJ2_9BILA
MDTLDTEPDECLTEEELLDNSVGGKDLNNTVDTDVDSVDIQKGTPLNANEIYMPKLTGDTVKQISKIGGLTDKVQAAKQLADFLITGNKEHCYAMVREFEQMENITSKVCDLAEERWNTLISRNLDKSKGLKDANNSNRGTYESCLTNIESLGKQVEKIHKSAIDNESSWKVISESTKSSKEAATKMYGDCLATDAKFVEYLSSYRKIRAHYRFVLGSSEAKIKDAMKQQMESMNIAKMQAELGGKRLKDLEDSLARAKDTNKKLNDIADSLMDEGE